MQKKKKKKKGNDFYLQHLIKWFEMKNENEMPKDNEMHSSNEYKIQDTEKTFSCLKSWFELRFI